jgi:hypothetical protein
MPCHKIHLKTLNEKTKIRFKKLIFFANSFRKILILQLENKFIFKSNKKSGLPYGDKKSIKGFIGKHSAKHR